MENKHVGDFRKHFEICSDEQVVGDCARCATVETFGEALDEIDTLQSRLAAETKRADEAESIIKVVKRVVDTADHGVFSKLSGDIEYALKGNLLS